MTGFSMTGTIHCMSPYRSLQYCINTENEESCVYVPSTPPPTSHPPHTPHLPHPSRAKHMHVARTRNLFCRKVFGLAMAYSPPVDDFTQQGRNEAAAKLTKNREVVRAGGAAHTAHPPPEMVYWDGMLGWHIGVAAYGGRLGWQPSTAGCCSNNSSRLMSSARTCSGCGELSQPCGCFMWQCSICPCCLCVCV